MNKAILEIKNINLGKTFHDFSISFLPNLTTTILGSNNCGKTTLIRILAGLLEKDNTFYNKKKYSSYSTQELNKIVQYIIPNEINFIYDNVTTELNYEVSKLEDYSEEELTNLLKKLKLTRIKNKKINDLNQKELIKLKLLICLLNKPTVLLLDDIYRYLDNDDISDIKKLLFQCNKNNELTIIQTISDLNNTLDSDYLYIINNSKIILAGTPLEVLENDNVLNKAGLEIPFLIDLSVKLRDYDLVSKIITNEKDLVEEIWKKN